MDVLRAFCCEGEDFTHYFAFSDGKFFNSIEYLGEFYDFENECAAEDDLEFKRLAKRFAKLAFYSVLKKAKAVSLPWGALTGIRPTKLAYAEAEAGRDFTPLFKQMDVSDNNIALVKSVLAAQKNVRKSGGQELFISVPFCPTKCEYCSFITAPVSATRGYIEKYTDCLIEEIASLKPYVKKLNSVYIGGGTPFVLEERQLERIYAAIRAQLGSVPEYTVEAGRPDVFTVQKLRLSKDFGVTRICVNPQSFNDATLKAIGRAHTAAQTEQAYAMAEKYGFDINIDLIAGLADETAEDFAYSLEKSVSLNPANITVHVLSLKSGARLKESVKRLNVSGIEEMVSLSRERLSAAGYFPYYLYRQKYQAGGCENVGWCRAGKACAYNVGVMEEVSDNIALGANAISKKLFGENRIERYATPKDIPTYINKLDTIITERTKLFTQQ